MMDEKKKARLLAAIQPQGNGYVPRRMIHYKPATPPQWAYWPAARLVEQWQAVALSLGIEPDSLEMDEYSHMREASFPSAEVYADFAKRLSLIHGLLGHWRPLPLAQFAALFGELSIPPELTAMRQAPEPEGSAPPKESGQTSTTTVNQGKAAGQQFGVDDRGDGQHPDYLTTSELVACFGGYMGVNNPRKVLSEYPDWATKDSALIRRGRRGKTSAQNPDTSAWDPVQFALNLLSKRPIPDVPDIGPLEQRYIDTVFSFKTLESWRPHWKRKKPL